MAAILRETIEAAAMPIRILGPAPCLITKLKDNFRFHLQLTAASFAPIRELWLAASPKFARPADVEFQIDVDPMNLR